jgi:hypothetical protein
LHSSEELFVGVDFLMVIVLRPVSRLTQWSNWAILDNNFDLGVFYNQIVELFEQDPDDPWVVDTLGFWNKCVDQVIKSFYLNAPQGSSKRPITQRNATPVI